MLLCGYHLIGALTLLPLIHTFVLLTANIDDVKKIARKFVSEPLAQQIAEMLVKATSNTGRSVSEENELNAEDVKQLPESERETFNKAIRQGKPNYMPRKIKPRTPAQEDTEATERTTQVIKPRKKVEANRWQKIEVTSLGRDKKNFNQEHPHILRESRPNKIEKKRQYWQQQQQQQQKNKELEKSQEEADGEEWQKREEIWRDRHSQDQDWQERLKETTERYIFKPKTERQEVEPQLVEPQVVEPQHEEHTIKRQKWAKVETNSESNWPQIESKQIFEHDEINSADYDLRTTETDLINKDQAVSDYEVTPDAFEKVKRKRKRQRQAKNKRNRFDLQNLEPKAKESAESPPKVNSFNIELGALTTEKERNEFDQYDNLKYKQQHYPRSELVATSGSVMLETLRDPKPVQMPMVPLELPKVDAQSWWNDFKEKEIEDKIE